MAVLAAVSGTVVKKEERGIFLATSTDAADAAAATAAAAADAKPTLGGVRFTRIDLVLSFVALPAPAAAPVTAAVDEALDDVDDEDFLRSFIRADPLALVFASDLMCVVTE